MPYLSTESVTMPRERAQQLRNLTAAIGARTFSETLGELFAVYARQGLAKHDFPGVEVHRLADGVTIKIADNERLGLSFQHAREFAAKLREAAKHSGGYLNVDHDWGIVRQGSGVSVRVPLSSATPKSYSPDLALELAGLIEQAATEVVTA